MIKNITIGSDPEFFIYKESSVISSIGIIEGTKWQPTFPEEGYGVHKDNVLIEGNIPPTKSKEEFVNNMKHWKEIASSILEVGGYKLVSADSAEFPEEMLKPFEARTFGCAPYMNAWTLKYGNPSNLAKTKHRVAGTHIHIGYDLEENDNYDKELMNILITRAFDYFLIYPSRLIYEDPVRSKYYGEYGNFRDKEYGVEVRSLGGHFSNDQFLGWIYDQTIKTLEYCSKPVNCELLRNIESPETNAREKYNILNINIDKELNGVNNINTTCKIAIYKAETK